MWMLPYQIDIKTIQKILFWVFIFALNSDSKSEKLFRLTLEFCCTHYIWNIFCTTRISRPQFFLSNKVLCCKFCKFDWFFAAVAPLVSCHFRFRYFDFCRVLTVVCRLFQIAAQCVVDLWIGHEFSWSGYHQIYLFYRCKPGVHPENFD